MISNEAVPEKSVISGEAMSRQFQNLPCLEMTIQELTDALFGIRPHPVLEAAGIEPLHPLYFNELV